MSFERIKDAVKAIQEGKLIIVTDSENRENEGDFIVSAEKITPDIVNFMAKEGRGLICAALTEDRCAELDLHPMVKNNNALNSTAFTVSVDLIGHGCTTGISSYDRAKTLNALADKKTKPIELGRPGHIFPIIAKPGGVLERDGHTEAAVELMKLAGLEPVGVLVEIINDDGTMARYDDLVKVAERFDIVLITIEQIIEYLNSDH
ncbi:3,4-dihydroxy-2-butanone-4-phosphate synthase [uncultured Draconibacterium sp.]|uniref:3,4-dihydroxy-2-butanone-4-phosphate synthase n=1 Tax=uncultured Draconibacterium sp. TaxID=1573823 RepID=UPI002AA5E99B|nr:3,4-dihydroxy-2-butanone-4-phosphate synthase [uncultured Draconibacterium sp.]